MHPPFGFALFFLRSVAPKVPYIDRLTGKRMEPVTTGQIYWGAVPFVVIQLIMVAIVVMFPNIVMHYKGSGVKVDPAAVQKSLDEILMPGLPGGWRPARLELRRAAEDSVRRQGVLGTTIGGPS